MKTPWNFQLLKEAGVPMSFITENYENFQQSQGKLELSQTC